MSTARISTLAFGLWSCTMLHAQFAGPFPIPMGPAGGAVFAPELLARYSGYMQCAATDRSLKLDVNAMAFDANGTLWLGLTNGLLRCDGDRQVLYQSQRKDSTSLPNNTVTSMLVDDGNRLWVGTQNGLARSDPSTASFVRYRIDADSLNSVRANRFWGLFDDGRDLIYCVTESGIHTIDKRTGAFHTIVHRINGEDPFDAAHFNQCAVLDNERRTLWAATSLGIMCIDLSNGAVRPLADDPRSKSADVIQASALCKDGDDHLWFFEREGIRIGRLDLRNGVKEYWPAPTSGTEQRVCRWMRSGPGHELWMETWDDALFLLKPTENRAVALFPAAENTGSGAKRPTVRQMLRDAKGRDWLATSAGAIALLPSDPRVQHWKLPGVADPNVELTAIHQLDDGTTILGSYREGIHIRDPRTGVWSNIKRTKAPRGERFLEAENSVLCFEPIDDDHLLVGTYHGILLLDLEKRELLDLPEYELANKRLTRSQITDLQFDRNGRLWVATWMQGLLCYDPRTDTCKRYQHDPADPRSLPIDRLLCLLLDHEGHIWIGANDGGGIFRYDDGTGGFIRYRMDGGDPQSPSLGVVRCMAEDTAGHIWLGTHMGGLARLDPASGAFQSYDRSDGLPGDLIRSIVIHPQLGLWVGGTEGVARWNVEQDVFIRPELGVEWVREPMAMQVIEASGKLLALNGPEAVLIDLKTLNERTTAPMPRLLEVRVNGRVVLRDGAAGALDLQQGRDRVSFEFALEDPIRAQSTRIAWRLMGRSDQWEDCLGCRSLSFSDLPKGDYQLEVRAMRSDGQWDAPASLATFNVFPPFWATWWFRICSVLVFAVAAFAAFRLYLRGRLREQRERMEREQAVLSERVRIAGDMHDDLGAGLSALKLKSEMALRVEKDPLKREQLGALANTAGELIGSMRQIIWTMNSDQASVEDLVVYTTSYARNYCAQNTLTIEVKADGPWPEVQLSTEQRRNVFLVVKEALHNVVKHANAKQVSVGMDWRDGLVVEVADDGVGISRGAEGGQGNGLRNMEKRINALGGSLDVDGGTEGGTSIRFQVNFAPTPNQGSIATKHER